MPVTGVFPAGVYLHLLETGIQAIQLSPYRADLPARRPIRRARLPVSWHAVFPGHPFRARSAIRSRDISSQSLPAARAIQQCASWRTRSVKPSAQPTLVRTQHLPPYKPSSRGMRPDHRRWLPGLRADLARRSREFRRCRVWPGQSPAAGSRRNLRPGALPGAVEWWLSLEPCCGGHRRGREVTAALACRFPPIRIRYMDTRESEFQHRSLNSAQAASPGQRPAFPSPPAAQRATPGWHDARRPLPRGPSRANRCRARRLGPGKHRRREADVTLAPRRPSVRAVRKAA